MTYPVCVVIPTIDRRWRFLTERCLPSVRRADPAEVVVVFGPGDANTKRNSGGGGTKQPYLLFVDDDCEVSADILKDMVSAFEANPDAALVYSMYRLLRSGPNGSSFGGEIACGKWNPDRLRRENYIDTTTLIRRSAFPGFDPEIRRFQDWDVWLTMAARGARGVYLSKTLFDKFIIDDGISAVVPKDEALAALRRKHGL